MRDDSSVPKPEKHRLDKYLVDQGFFENRSKAQGVILAGQVTVNGQKQDKPGTMVTEADIVNVLEKLKYVSRGGLKLEKALQEFAIPVENRVCLDAGASTGGFTDCLLQQGASFVHAVDVGYGQLDWKLRSDDRVHVMERTHMSHLTPDQLDPSPDLAVADVSFISLKKVLPAIMTCLQPEQYPQAEIIALVKPQFEYGDYFSLKDFDGVVRDAEKHAEILYKLGVEIAQTFPTWQLTDVIASPIVGPKGNREFFFWLKSRHNEVVSRDVLLDDAEWLRRVQAITTGIDV